VRASDAFVGVCDILQRKTLIDVESHVSRSHGLEQLLRASFERIAARYEVEADWARQKLRTSSATVAATSIPQYFDAR
jgi:hypothetical protein